MKRTKYNSCRSWKESDTLNITKINSRFEADFDFSKIRTQIKYQDCKRVNYYASHIIFEPAKDMVRGIVLTSDDSYFIVASQRGKLGIFETESGELKHEFTNIHESNLFSLRINQPPISQRISWDSILMITMSTSSHVLLIRSLISIFKKEILYSR